MLQWKQENAAVWQPADTRMLFYYTRHLQLQRFWQKYDVLLLMSKTDVFGVFLFYFIFFTFLGIFRKNMHSQV